MTEKNAANSVATVDEIQQGWHELTLRVRQLEAERGGLEQENKALRFLLERVIEHRQKSHGELVLLLTGLVSKLPINDVGVLVSKLVEHNTQVSAVCALLAKGKADTTLPQPQLLRALDQTKTDLAAASKRSAEELISLDSPFAKDMLQAVIAKPDQFFSPAMTRANRSFIKGQVPRERIVKEFGEEALNFFNDMTTDKKLNPKPKPEEIVLAFKSDFESLLKQNAALSPDKRKGLQALHERIQRSKAPTEQARAQRNAFQRLSFAAELLYYYQNQNTEAPEGVFAQRLPALVEALVITGAQDNLDEKLIAQAENLLAFVISPDHRQAVVNNIGKSGGTAKSLKYVLALRMEKMSEPDALLAEFVKHLLTLEKKPRPEMLVPILRLLKPDRQRLVVHAIMDNDRIPREEAHVLGVAIGKALALPGLDAPKRGAENVPPEIERQMAWEKVKEMILSRAEPNAIAAAVRQRLHARYDADEMKQSWITLTEADPISLIRVFCQLPYLADGRTDPIARAVMETYVNRLTHEKYATTYTKVVSSLKNMFRANPSSPTLLNFLELVKWVDASAAGKLSSDIGMPVPAR